MMDANFMIIAIGVFLGIMMIKFMMSFRYEENEKETNVLKEKVSLLIPKVNSKPNVALGKSDVQKGKVIDLDERRKMANRKKSEHKAKYPPTKNDTLKGSPSKKQWWI